MSTRKQLGQAVDSVGNTATEIYSPSMGIRALGMMLKCSNVAASDATVRVYQDQDGESYSEATALYYDYPVAADSTVNLEIGPMANPLSRLAVSSSVASAVTFTLHGQEVWYGVPNNIVVPPGRARVFESGNNDSLSASHTVSGSTFSMTAWIKISSTAGLARTIMGLFASGSNDTDLFEMQLTTAGALRSFVSNGGLGTANDWRDSDSNATDWRDGAWHLVACTRDGSNSTVWVDGVPDTPATLTETRTFPTIDTIAVGRRMDSVPSAPFEGDIDECTLWEGKKLTDAHVAALYATGINDSVLYLPKYQSIGVPIPTHHYSLSVDLNPTTIGNDEIGTVDLTDNGTADVEGIIAGEGPFVWDWGLYENLGARYDMTDLTTMFTDVAGTTQAGVSDTVALVVDQSGNGHDLIQATASKRPLVVAVADGTGFALKFDGSDDFMQSATFGTALSQPNDVVISAAVLSTSIGEGVFDGGTDTHKLYNYSNSQSLYADGSFGTSSANFPTALTTYLLSFNGAASEIYNDGGSDIFGSTAIGTNTLDGVTVGSLRTGSANSDIVVRQIIVNDGALSTTDRNLICTKVAEDQGLTWSDIA